MHILAISSSTRQVSTNTAFLMAMKECAQHGIEFFVFHRLNLRPGWEGDTTPPEIVELMAFVSASDGIVISSPEYVRAIPGGLKNAIDWMLSRSEIIEKPIAIAHASYRGDDMLDSLRLVLSTVSNKFLENIFLHIPLIGKTPDEIASSMRLPEHRLRISEFLDGFAAEIRQLKEK